MQTEPQENNNFETIISTWRRMSGELIESPAFTSMSGDSSHPFKKKEEDSNMLVLERPKGPLATVASAGAVVATNDKIATQEPADKNNPEEKNVNEELSKQDKEETKEAAGDADFDDDKDDKSFLENDPSKVTETKPPKDRGDKVDSVYLRPPPAHKVRSNTSSAADDEDCGIKCLYYTLQCCDCVLM